MNKVSLVVITDGRQDCINKTIECFEKIIDYSFFEKIIINDSAEIAYHNYLERNFPQFRIVSHEERRGLAGAVQSAWSSISKESEYVFHLEDDFLLNKQIDIDNMISILKNNDHLIQLALVRDCVNPAESEVGGFVFQKLNTYTQKDGFFEHTNFFTLNPSIYDLRTMNFGWPDHGSESDFAYKVFDNNLDLRAGFYGNIYDPPLVTHIGGRRSSGWFL